MTEIWQRATSIQPVPPAEVVGLVALVALALVLVPALWPLTRLIITITHEAGHAFAALLVGRRLQGIRLHSDTSGLTVSKGKARGPGMVFMLASGYLAPAVVGLGASLLLTSGRSLGLLWLIVVLLALMLLQIRNVYGFFALLGVGVAMVAVSWFLSPVIQSLIAYLITWVLLFAAPKPVVELFRQRRRGAAGSDADQLAQLTRLPAGLWMLIFLVANLAGLVVGVLWLLPDLRDVIGTLTAR